MRGEKIGRSFPFAPCVGSPPLARGKARAVRVNKRRIRITPACAGKSFLFYDIRFTPKDHPRLRGEKQPGHTPENSREGSPPLARGKVYATNAAENQQGITPACAGKRAFRRRKASTNWDHPRLRGEKMSGLTPCTSQRGSPPLARGKVPAHDISTRKDGITPACAGKSRADPAERLGAGDHPRLRGEKCAGDFEPRL